MYGAEPMITSYFPQSAICFWAFPALAWFYLTDTTLSPALQNSLQEACPLQPKSKIPSVLNISPQGPPPPHTHIIVPGDLFALPDKEAHSKTASLYPVW